MSLTATPDGVLLVDKAAGMTSHDVVAIVRRRLQMKKVGHCGTLDPIATGLLLLTLGRGTKIQDLLMSEDKEYAGTMMLGVTTDTQDRAGVTLEERPVPPLDDATVRAAFEKYSRRFLPDAADGLGDQARRRAALQTRAPGQNRRTRAAPGARLSTTRSTGSRRRKSISASSAAKAFTFAPTRTTSARRSAAERISRICAGRSRAGSASTVPSPWTN